MKFLDESQYKEKCDRQFATIRDMANQILPYARVEHIGSSAVGGLISKGDLDVFVGVPGDFFENSIKLLLNHGFVEKQDTHRSNELCMLVSTIDDIALQLVANGSRYEFFLTFRDLLRESAELRQEYNELKVSSKGLSQSAYQEKKSIFINKALDIS